jgi:hypothetical protein
MNVKTRIQCNRGLTAASGEILPKLLTPSHTLVILFIILNLYVPLLGENSESNINKGTLQSVAKAV